MNTIDNPESTGGDRERDRVAAELASRLRARGVAIRDDDSNDAVSAMEEAVERVRVQGDGVPVDNQSDECPEDAGRRATVECGGGDDPTPDIPRGHRNIQYTSHLGVSSLTAGHARGVRSRGCPPDPGRESDVRSGPLP